MRLQPFLPQVPTPPPSATTYSVLIQQSARSPLHKNFRTPIVKTLEDLENLLTWPEGWNGYDVAAPNLDAVRQARLWIQYLYDDIIHTSLRWKTPHVTASEDGDVLFEWWNDEKGLSVYITAQGKAEYIMDWGPNIVTEMEDGNASITHMRNSVWPRFLDS